MLKSILLHLLKWTSILILCLIALAVGVFFLDFKHALTSDVKLNFIYTSLLTVGLIPFAALLWGGLSFLKKAIDAHELAQEQAEAEAILEVAAERA